MMRILLCLHGSRASEAALRAVIAEREPRNTVVRILSVVRPEASKETVGEAETMLDRSAAALRSAGFGVEVELVKDSAAEAIVWGATKWDADMIVLGWHGRTTLKRYLFGGVTAAVMRGVPCSVELVRFRPERCESEACRREQRGDE